MESRAILLGTGNPNPDFERFGPSVAITVDDSVYIVDFGVGLVRRAVEAGFIITNLDPLEVYGPKGITEMTRHIMAAYDVDINERIHGLEPAERSSYIVDANEISEGRIYQDNLIAVEAFQVNHGSLEAYG